MTEDVGLGATEIRTFLIADVRGYTHFTSEQGDEAGARLAARFAEVVGEQIESRGGTVVELRGDEALCVFGSPRKALRAAVDLQRRFADELRADPSLPLRVGIGIDAGEAVAVAGGYRGGALNLAARLCSIAGPGEVLVSEGIVHLARHVDQMSYVDRGRVELKGMDRPVQVMQVRFELDMPSAARVAVRRWTPARLAATAVGGIVLVALVILVATRGGGDHPASLGTNVVGILDSSGHIVGQVPLGGRPGGVAAGAGSVWVTNAEHGTVLRIDPRAGSIVDTIHVGGAPTGVAVGDGGVWVANSGGGTVSWINAAAPSNQPPTPIQVGQCPGPVTYGDDAAWVVNTTDGTLQQINPVRLKPEGAAIAIGGAPTAVAVGGGSIWVSDTSSSSVVEVNRRTLQVTRHAVGNNPVAVAYGAGRVWVANSADGTVTSLDPTTDQPTEIPVGRNPTSLAYASGAVWVAVGQPASVVRIDAVNRHVSTVTPVSSAPQAVAASGDDIWVTALAAPASHRGDTLRMVFATDRFRAGLSPFDPAVASEPEEWQALSLTNDGLVTYRRAGAAAGTQVVPDLAVAMPSISDAGLTYTFQLRRGIDYSNGQQVQASDFRYAVQRQFLPSALGRGFHGAFQNEVFANLVGYDTCANPPHTCHLATAIKTDDKAGTITIHLARPDPDFVEKLATSFGDLVPPGSPPPDSGGPVPATGPYMVSRIYAHGRGGFLMVRNPRFREWSADAQPAGYPDKLRWSYVSDKGSELTAVEYGTADVMVDQPPTEGLAGLQDRYAALAHPFTYQATTYLALNTRVSPFNRLAVRKALNFAVDRAQVAKLEGGSQVATPTCQVLPPSLPGYAAYCPYTDHPSPSGTWTTTAVAKAKRLIAGSGTQGTHVTVWVCPTESPHLVTMSRYLASVLNRIGYPTVVNDAVANCFNFFKRVGDSRNHIQASLSGWISDYPSPINFLDVLLTCHAFVPASTGNLNVSEFCNKPLDGLVRRAEAVQGTDPTRAVQLWQAADRQAVNQAPWVPLTNGLGLDVISPHLGNYQHNSQWGILLDQLWVK